MMVCYSSRRKGSRIIGFDRTGFWVMNLGKKGEILASGAGAKGVCVGESLVML